MKKVIKYAALLMISGSMIFTGCGKKSEDPAPEPTPTTPTCSGGSVKSLTYDVTAANPYGNPVTQENGSVKVTKCDGSYKLVINMNSDVELDYLYITKSVDGGAKVPVKLADYVDNNGKTWKGDNNNYTLKAPESGYKSFTINLSFPVRSVETGADVYEAWFTDATLAGNGSFKFPKNYRAKGPINANYNYGTVTFTTTTFDVTSGSQGNTTQPSYINTSGVGDSYLLSEILEDSTTRFPEVNMLFYVLNTSLSARSTTTPALVSPDQRTALGYTTLKNGNTTKFDLYTGSFDAATANELKLLTPATSNAIAITAGNVYSFKSTTSLGLVKVKSITGTGDNRTATFTIKVLSTSK